MVAAAPQVEVEQAARVLKVVREALVEEDIFMFRTKGRRRIMAA